MSRRESRDSDSRRHRSRFDREPSLKRSRRDGKPATERVPSSNNLDTGVRIDEDQTDRGRLQDVLPLEPQSTFDSNVDNGSLAKESDKKPNGLQDKPKGSSDPTKVPRSRSYFQHDERGNAGQVGRTLGRGAADERDGRRDSRNRKNGGASDKKESYDARPRDEKLQSRGIDKSVWNYDEFFKLDADPPPPGRKRRAFREERIPLDSENANKAAFEPVKVSRPDRAPLGSERREERGHNFRHSARSEKPPTGDRFANRGELQRGGYLSRQRYGGGGSGDGSGGRGDYRVRDRYDGRQEFRSGGTRGEKWKHDLFQEANRSPTPKDEDDRIAKLEALLAS